MYPVAGVLSNTGTVTAAASKAAASLPEAASTRSAVKQLLKSAMREICTLGSVGAGDG